MQNSAELDTLGKRLFYLRQSSNKTLQEVSNECKVSRSNLGKYEKDVVKPSAEAIVVLSDFYEVSTDWLLKGIEAKSKIQEETKIIFDQDTKDMLEAVKLMMSDSDPEARSWAKVQFRKSFAEYFPKKDERK
ncbi:MAG: Helix-turn-helix domain [Firmicutes bacterium]|nr:Helix-turn-helix domain [Bacillota bacterium]